MRVALAVALLGTAMVGCSASTTSTSGDAGLADAVGGDTPGGSGVVRSFTTYVLAACPVGTATSACPAQAQITVFARSSRGSRTPS